MDADIKRLIYVQRRAGSGTWNGIPGATQLIGGLPGAPGRDEVAQYPSKMPDVRLEARIVELESERAEIQKRHREELDAVHKSTAEMMSGALAEQKEALERKCAAEVVAALSSFREEQKRYFQEAESALLRLALGIAARVLHREAQLDPLLLRGPVRVALEDAQKETACVLEVAEGEVGKWRQWLSSDSATAFVEVRGKQNVAAGHCRIEMGASTADLSVHSQLAEIERGFFDLLNSRPGAPVSERERSQ
ncbi:MAG TPA: FliH/SctL family protein [Acidobacteriaceae bacterium]